MNPLIRYPFLPVTPEGKVQYPCFYCKTVNEATLFFPSKLQPGVKWFEFKCNGPCKIHNLIYEVISKENDINISFIKFSTNFNGFRYTIAHDFEEDRTALIEHHDVADDGTIYFPLSTTRFTPDNMNNKIGIIAVFS